MTREEIIAYVETMRKENRSADLAFYALRDLSRTDWTPFLKAALERNPVCIEATKVMSDEELIQALEKMDSMSIYDGPRLAQPDEVWNYKTGDGIEKAILLANVWLARRSVGEGGKKRHPAEKINLTIQPDRAELSLGGQTLKFSSSKGLTVHIPL